MTKIKLFLRSRTFTIMVITCSIVITSGYLHLYCLNSTVQNTAWWIFWIAAIAAGYDLLLFLWAVRKPKNLGDIEDVSSKDKDAFIQTAGQMNVRIDSKRPFRKMKRYNNISANAIPFQPCTITFGEDLYNRLDSSEKLAVLAHEFAHIKMCHGGIKLFATFLMVIPVLFTVPILSREYSMSLVMIFTAFFMGLWISSYFCEYLADCVAVKNIRNTEALILALRNMDPEDKRDLEYVTHPSVNARIAWLNRNACH